MTHHNVKGHGTSRALAGFVIAGALALFLSAPPVHAQSATISAGVTDPSISGIGNNDYDLVSLCVTYSYDACFLVASFNSGVAPYWYVSGGSSNGLGGAPIYYYINGVYQSTYHANGATNPGAITVLGATGANYAFLGAQYYGSCTNNAYYSQGWYASIPASDDEAYTLGIPYSCS
jgi:hypothetical protein